MRINTNISALNAWKNLTVTDTLMGKSLEKLSSGFRINRAADDAAGLAISEKMKAQISGLRQGARNAQDGISLIQTAEGALNETHSILQRMRELATQAASTTVSDSDRSQIQAELDELSSELDRIADSTKFNGISLLNGDTELDEGGDAIGVEMKILIGTAATKEDGEELSAEGTDQFTIKIRAMGTEALLGEDDISVEGEEGESGQEKASLAVATIDAAIEKVSSQRATLGAYQNRLEHTINNLNTAAENLAAAESRIRDVDMALEMATFTRHQILLHAGTAMLAQSNVKPQSVLKLLG